MGYSQTSNTESNSNKQDTKIEKENTTEVDVEKYKSFLGTYLLVEGDLTLDIIQEDNKLYIVSPFSTDVLTPVNDSTLSEDTRGVVLELIKDNKDGLKFTQNGYETVIERVKSKTKK